jgi:hypothetical protein
MGEEISYSRTSSAEGLRKGQSSSRHILDSMIVELRTESVDLMGLNDDPVDGWENIAFRHVEVGRLSMSRFVNLQLCL